MKIKNGKGKNSRFLSLGQKIFNFYFSETLNFADFKVSNTYSDIFVYFLDHSPSKRVNFVHYNIF